MGFDWCLYLLLVFWFVVWSKLLCCLLTFGCFLAVRVDCFVVLVHLGDDWCGVWCRLVVFLLIVGGFDCCW